MQIAAYIPIVTSRRLQRYFRKKVSDAARPAKLCSIGCIAVPRLDEA